MKSTIRKFRTSEYWRIGEHESWFTDMAAKGYHLKKIGSIFVHFEIGDPEKMRYRIDVSTDKNLTEEQKQKYASVGWDYVASYNKFHVFKSPAELNVPEFAPNLLALKDFYEKLRFNTGAVTASVIIYIGLMLFQLFSQGTPFLNLIKGNVVFIITSTVLMGYLAYSSIKGTIAIHILHRNLIVGNSIDHRAPWEKRFRNNKILGICISIVVIVGSTLPFIQLINREDETLPEVSPELPIVRLADLEQNPNLIRETDMFEGRDWLNHYRSDWSLLAPVQYETTEYGKVPGEMWDDESGAYSPSIRSEIYQVSLPFLTDGLSRDVMKWHSYGYREFVEKEHPEFDHIYIGVESFIEIVAAKGKAVMYVRYSGNADLDTVLEKVAEKMAMISE